MTIGEIIARLESKGLLRSPSEIKDMCERMDKMEEELYSLRKHLYDMEQKLFPE